MSAPSLVQIAKAGMTAGTTLATAGLFGPEQFKKFFELVQLEPTLMRDLEIQPMGASVSKMESLEFGGPITISVDEEEEVLATDYGEMTAAHKDLEAKKIKATASLTWEFKEDLLKTGQSPEAYVSAKMAKRFALDMQYLGWLGDTTLTGNKLLKRLDGFFKQMTSNGIDYTSDAQPVNEDRFYEAYLSLPERYRQDKSNLRFYCNDDIITAYNHQISKRETTLGDIRMINGAQYTFWNGVMLYPVSDCTAGTMALTSRKNLKPGVYRDVTSYQWEDYDRERTKYAISARIDFKVYETAGCVPMIGMNPLLNITTV